MSRILRATTPFPNSLLDEAMPKLRDTEWRVLCVIIRQTLGWQSKGSKQRKTSDWLTQCQFVKKSGRDRAAISRAIEALVQRQLIEVRNESGNLLASSQQRRQCKSKQYFGLHPRFFGESHIQATDGKNEIAKSEYHGAGSNSLLQRKPFKSEYHSAPKANTTKETETKEIVTKRILQNSLLQKPLEIMVAEVDEVLESDAHSDNANSGNQLETQQGLWQRQKEYSDAARKFIATFQEMALQDKESEIDITLSIPDALRLESLLAIRPAINWTKVLHDFFESDAAYITRHHYSLLAFLNSYNILSIK